MSKPVLIWVKPHGSTYKAKAAGKGGDKLSCTSTAGLKPAADAWVAKFYGSLYKAVDTGKYHNSGQTLWEVWECVKRG